jgi:hypothetical protein
MKSKLFHAVILVIGILILAACGKPVTHPKGIDSSIHFNKDIKIFDIATFDYFSNYKGISLVIENMSGQDLEITDDDIEMYVIKNNEFQKVNNGTDDIMGGYTMLPAKDTYKRNGRISIILDPQLEITTNITLRIYVFGMMNDTKIGSYVDISLTPPE